MHVTGVLDDAPHGNGPVVSRSFGGAALPCVVSYTRVERLRSVSGLTSMSMLVVTAGLLKFAGLWPLCSARAGRPVNAVGLGWIVVGVGALSVQ